MRHKHIKNLLLALALFAVAANPAVAQVTATSEPARHFDHVLIVVLENQDYEDVIKNPYMKWLAAQGCVFSNFHAPKHPSYPNYLAMICGDTLGVLDDIQKDFDVPTVADLLEAKNLTWKQYAEGYPGNCFTGASFSRYRRKHVPFMSFRAIQKNPARCANVVDNHSLDPAHLPNYAFFTPDMDDDGHDTGLKPATAWLEGFLKPFFAKPELLDQTLLEITFDESRSHSPHPNHIYTVFLGHMVKPGAVVETPTDHYSVLRTIEDNFGIGTLNKEDAKATPVTGIWSR
jgi:hypothetical protein